MLALFFRIPVGCRGTVYSNRYWHRFRGLVLIPGVIGLQR